MANSTDNKKSILGIFQRRKRLESPSHINDYVHVTSVSTYAISFTCLILLAALLVWAFLGNVTDKSEYSGVIFPVEGTHDISLPNAGIVSNIMVHNGEYVNKGQNVALVSMDGSYSTVSSDVSGTVMDAKVDGEKFNAMEPIVSIVNKGDSYFLAYADNEHQRDLRPGMKAQIWPADEDRDEIGYFTGTILSISRYPVTREEIQQRFRNADVVKSVLPEEGAIYEVKIALDKNCEDELCWSFGKPADVNVTVGTFCKVMTETKKRSIIEYLFEKIRTGEHQVEQWVR